jgi:erythromycin esterase-like protein
MSKNRFILIISLLGIIFYLHWFYHYTPLEDEKDKYLQIKSYLHPLQIDDFSFLSTELHNKRIIVLGEQLHQDGKTFSIKEKIIHYLHENRNYNVVLYEAGLYDMWLMANDSDTLNPSTGLYPFWWNNEETKDLWNYYRNENRRKDSIYLGGFDIQLTGNTAGSSRVNQLTDYLNRKKISLNHDSLLLHFLKEGQRYMWWDGNTFTKEQKDLILTELDDIATCIQQIENPVLEDKIYYRYLSGLKQRFESIILYPEVGNPQRMQLRDSLMAGNLIWLADSVFPNKKIIVWMANLHAVHPDDSLHYFPWKTTGSYLKNHYKDSLYTVVFSSFGRLNSRGSLYKKMGNKSLEYLIHTTGMSYGYIKSGEVAPCSFLNREFISGINQGINMNAQWLSMLDLYIHIDEMTSITPVKE